MKHWKKKAGALLLCIALVVSNQNLLSVLTLEANAAEIQPTEALNEDVNSAAEQTAQTGNSAEAASQDDGQQGNDLSTGEAQGDKLNDDRNTENSNTENPNTEDQNAEELPKVDAGEVPSETGDTNVTGGANTSTDNTSADDTDPESPVDVTDTEDDALTEDAVKAGAEDEVKSDENSEDPNADETGEDSFVKELENGVTVSANVPEGAFDEAVELVAARASEDEVMPAVMDKLQDAYEESDFGGFAGVYCTDISFKNSEENAVQPKEEIQITITVPAEEFMEEGVSLDELDEEELVKAVYHIVGEEAEDLQSGDIQWDTENAVVEISFSSKSFSPFAAVIARTGVQTLESNDTNTYYVDDDSNAEAPNGTENAKFKTIQAAVNAICEVQKNDESDQSYTIQVAAGTYERFLIPHGVKNIVIQGVGDETTVTTLDSSDLKVEESEKHNSDGGGIIIWGADITLQDMRITSGGTTPVWYASAVGTQDGMWGPSSEQDTAVILENCTFEGSGSGYAFMPQRSKFTMNNCRVDNYEQAVYFAGDGFETQDCNVTNNTITNCIYAIHGYFGAADSLKLVKPMVIEGNTVKGASDRYSVIAILDQTDKGSVKLDIKDNTFSYTIVGGINMCQKGDVSQGSMEAVKDANTMQDNSFVVDAYWYKADDYGTTFYISSPEGKIATWYADPTSEAGSNLDKIKAALEDHGTAGDVIEITSADYNQEIFTMAKNAIVIKEIVDAGNLKIEKKVEGNDSDSSTFVFTVKFTRENGKPLNGVYDVEQADGEVVSVKLDEGEYRFTLKAGESITIKDLFPGTRYEVTERKKAYYTSQSEGESGTIVANQTQNVKFVNTYVSPLDPVEWEKSKSKTATNLDDDFNSQVTLSLPAADYEPEIDVVFVIDDTHAGKSIFTEPAEKLLNELKEKENLNVNLGIVTFDAIARDWIDVTSDGAYSGLVSIKDEKGLGAVYKALEEELDYDKNGRQKKIGATNLEWPLEMAGQMLASGSGVEKHVILFSDMYGYVYRGSLTIDGVTYEDVPVGKRLYKEMVKLASGTKYDNFADILVHRDEADLIEDSFFRDSSWDDYWSIYSGKETPDMPKNPYIVPQKSYSSYETSCCLTYDRILSLAQSAHVTIVNNDFEPEPGSTPSARKIKNEMLEVLTDKGINVIKTSKEPGTDEISDVFDDLKNELIQLVDAGSTVEDVIGFGQDEKGNAYDFEFVNDIEAIELTVNGKPLDKKSINDTTYGFGPKNGSKDGSTYPFVLHYYVNGKDGKSDECFVWDINVEVTVDQTVQLKYVVHLTNPQGDAGTYGQYDKDGSFGYSGLYTNKEATLIPVDSNGGKGEPEVFEKPTVSYTVTKQEEPGKDEPKKDDPEKTPDNSGSDSSSDPTPAVNTVQPTVTAPVAPADPTAQAPADSTATPDPAGAATGDNAPVAIWLVVAVMAATALIGLMYYKSI